MISGLRARGKGKRRQEKNKAQKRRRILEREHLGARGHITGSRAEAWMWVNTVNDLSMRIE